MSRKTCRWGFLSTSGIGRKNWQAIANTENATLVAIASRGLDRAQAYIDECQAQVPHATPPDAVASYGELIERDDVDAVYLPIPTGLRKEWVLRSAEAGKHVMVEKPIANSAADAQEMLDACKANNVLFMDGVMFMHTDRQAEMTQILRDGERLGEIRRIVTHHTFCGPPEFLANDIRMHSELEPFGCLGDVGWYNLRAILWATNYELPEWVSAQIIATGKRLDSPGTVPTEFSAEYCFPSGITAHSYSSFRTGGQQWFRVGGTKAALEVRDFVLPNFGSSLDYNITAADFIQDCCQFNMEDRSVVHQVQEYGNNHRSAQETRLFSAFSQLVLDGDLDPKWGEIALATQRLLDAVFSSAQQDGKRVYLA
ncbi:MAG: putative dehydrogenase [Rhodothermales bacterium]|jgi:predicted dehydrogenase